MEQDQQWTVSIPDEVDRETLKLVLPKSFDLAHPTPTTLASLYKSLSESATELQALRADLDSANADVERRDVELEQAIRDKQNATAKLETSLRSAKGELSQVKEERDRLGKFVDATHPFPLY